MDAIELSTEKAFDLIVSFVDLAQKTGAFQLKEAAIIHKAVIKLKNQEKIDDPNFTEDVARNILVQAVNAGQSKGSYNLDQAALLDKAVSVYFAEKQQEVPQEAPVEKTEEGTPLRVI